MTTDIAAAAWVELRGRMDDDPAFASRVHAGLAHSAHVNLTVLLNDGALKGRVSTGAVSRVLAALALVAQDDGS